MKILLFFLFFVCSLAHAGFTDLKFGRFQVADTQWNVNACMNTNTCQIYSKNPGIAYRIPWTSGQLNWGTGDYIKFELSGNASFPYIARQYTSNGTLKSTLGSGKVLNAGSDYFFFMGSDNNTGQLFSGTLGMSGSAGVTWTGIRNPTTDQVNAATASYSSEPLSSGQTASPSAPTYSATITTEQQNKISAARARQTYKNEINIDQIGHYNNIEVIQSGHYHLVDINVIGNTNNIDVSQYGIKNYAKIQTINGNNNSVNVYQHNTGGAQVVGHFTETLISGSNNTVNLNQLGDGEKRNFTNINGNLNTVNHLQSGAGTKYSDIKTTGNGHSITLDQKDGGAHAARIEVTNNGGSSTVNVLQQGNTNQTYSVQQSCATVGGCSVGIQQQ
jgi:hypothetical protein